MYCLTQLQSSKQYIELMNHTVAKLPTMTYFNTIIKNTNKKVVQTIYRIIRD